MYFDIVISVKYCYIRKGIAKLSFAKRVRSKMIFAKILRNNK